MARPRRDGRPTRATIRRKLTDGFVMGLKAEDSPLVAYDDHQGGLAVVVQPSGHKSWKALYYVNRGQPRWYHLGNVDDVALRDARRLAAKIMLRAAAGEDPYAERVAARNRGTFEELATLYVERHAKKKNKSWRQADSLVRKHLIPRWGRMKAAAVSRSDVQAMMARIEAETVANQVKAAASAIFSWAIKHEIVKENPCKLVDDNQTVERDRVLSDSELPKFWRAFDDHGLKGVALKMILLTGQRPGEVVHLRREHVVDGWWQMPGKPVPDLNWPGTKNGRNHRVWLPAAAGALLDELGGDQPFGRAGRVSDAMIEICRELRVNEKATPHDLRRTHGTMITRLKFGREAMNRIQNHVEGGIAGVYDRHHYSDENKNVMETVAKAILSLAEGDPGDNVVRLRK